MGMAFKDGSKVKTFKLWKDGLTVRAIQGQVTAKPTTVRQWVLQWERGRQGKWNATVK
jgi:hypothetical protein